MLLELYTGFTLYMESLQQTASFHELANQAQTQPMSMLCLVKYSHMSMQIKLKFIQRIKIVYSALYVVQKLYLFEEVPLKLIIKT